MAFAPSVRIERIGRWSPNIHSVSTCATRKPRLHRQRRKSRFPYDDRHKKGNHDIVLHSSANLPISEVESRAGKEGSVINANGTNAVVSSVGQLPPLKTPNRSKYLSPADWSRRSNDHDIGASSSQLSFYFDRSWTRDYHRMVDEGKTIAIPSLSYLSQRYLSPNKSSMRGRSRRSLHRVWIHVPSEKRSQLLQQTMLWCLQYDPKRAMQLLLATLKGHQIRPTRHVVADCLDYLAKKFLLNVQDPDPQSIKDLFYLVHKYVEGRLPENQVQSVPNQVVYLLLKCGSDEQVSSMLREFQETHVQLHANTLLHALRRSIDYGDVEYALDLLEKIAQSGLSLTSSQVQKACARLIRAHYGSADPFPIQMSLFTRMLEMGVRPNVHLFNAALLSATSAGQYQLALQMHEVAKANMLPSDLSTYRLLLNIAVRTNDHKLYRMVMGDIEGDRDAREDQVVLTDLLSVISRLDSRPFPAMLAFYRRHWDIEPLIDLSIIDSDTSATVTTDNEDLIESRPSDSVIGLMMCSYVKALKDSNISDCYKHYRKCVEEDHPMISRLAQTDHVGNAFIMKYGRRAQTLPHCALVIKDMLSDVQRKGPLDHSRDVGQPSGPSIRTWTILASSYLRHGQQQAAFKVFDIMHKRKVANDQVAWNTLIEGLSSLQDIENAVDNLLGMQKAGFEFDKRTLKGLRRIGNRYRLLSAMKESFQQGTSDHPRSMLPGDVSNNEEIVTPKDTTGQFAFDIERDSPPSLSDQ